jgi:hypothetical protein
MEDPPFKLKAAAEDKANRAGPGYCDEVMLTAATSKKKS